MAKDNTLRDIKRLYGQLFRQINKESSRKLVGAMAKKQIYNRVKSGYGVNVTGQDFNVTKKQKLKPLSQLYIDYRSGKVKVFTNKTTGKPYVVNGKFPKPKLGRFGSPKRSNLTLKGKMLEALTYKTNNKLTTIYVKNTARAGEKLTNAELSDLVQKNGRPYLSLTKTEWRVITKRIELILSREIRKLFN